MKVLILLLLFPFLVLSSDLNELEKAFTSIRSVKVVFLQKVNYPWTTKAEISKGFFYAQPGGKFRIEYEQPEKLIIVSDSREILIYSPEEKVAIKDNIQNNKSPVIEALFLVSKPLSSVFEKVGELQKNGVKTLVLKPKLKDEHFNKVYVDVDDNLNISSIKIENKDGTVVAFEIVSVSKNFTPSQNLFSTETPKGTKIIKQ